MFDSPTMQDHVEQEVQNTTKEIIGSENLIL
jgi:hypothetical protein